MRTLVLPLAAAMTAVVSVPVLAHRAGDSMARLQNCPQLQGDARHDCLDQLSREFSAAPGPSPAAKLAQAPATPPARVIGPVADTWLVTETTSPLDYSPIAIATATAAGGADGATMSLSVQCRSGRTDIVVAGTLVQRGPQDAVVSYMVNAGPPLPVAVGAAPSGNGLVFRLDTVRLITSLPDDGNVTVRVAARQGGAVEGQFSLAGLAKARAKIAGTCKWPAAAGRPRS